MVDFEEGFKAFLADEVDLAFALVLDPVLAGLAATLGSLTSFFTVDFFVSLATVSFLEAGFFAAGDLVALAVVLDLDLEDFTGTFLVDVALDVFAGLFYAGYELCS